MTTPIGSITPLVWSPQGLGSVSGTATPAGFQELLSKSWQETQSLASGSQVAIEQELVGGDLSMVESFAALRESDIALKLMLQIRNKLVDAYQEIQQIRF